MKIKTVAFNSGAELAEVRDTEAIDTQMMLNQEEEIERAYSIARIGDRVSVVDEDYKMFKYMLEDV